MDAIRRLGDLKTGYRRGGSSCACFKKSVTTRRKGAWRSALDIMGSFRATGNGGGKEKERQEGGEKFPTEGQRDGRGPPQRLLVLHHHELA